jgi:long-chain fatty acid transport protein
MLRISRRTFAVAFGLALAIVPRAARSGGFEILEQSPSGVASAGALGAVADDASTVFYNPAGMAFQHGFQALAGGVLAHTDTHVELTQNTHAFYTGVQPTVFGTLRLGRYFAVGVGGFSQFAEHFDYPRDWEGRFQGTFVDLTTYTFNPSIAFRPMKQLAIAAGLQVVPASLNLRRALDFGGGEGQVHAVASDIGVGGNAAVMLDLWPGVLSLGVTWRSRVNLDFEGKALLTVPPELAASAPMTRFDAVTHIPLPHNFDFAAAIRLVPNLVLTTDVHYTLWSDLRTLTLTLTQPVAPGQTASIAPMQQSVVLDFKNSWGVRAGVRWSPEKYLIVRFGGGYDESPVPHATLNPLIPDTDRVLIGGGLGWHNDKIGVEASYLAVILLGANSTLPELPARYETVGHVVSVAATFTCDTPASPEKDW